MNNKDRNYKVGLICSITQILISITCLTYNIINKEDYVLWIIMLCSGICILSSNISLKNSK